MGLCIITLFFLLTFSTLYISKGMEKKPDLMVKAVDKIVEHIELLAFWGVVYSLVAIILTPVLIYGIFPLVVIILANLMLFFMTLPYMLDHFLIKYPGKIPSSVVTELKNIVGVVASREKIAGYAGAALSFMLFLMLAR